MVPERTIQVDEPQSVDNTLIQHPTGLPPVQLDVSFQKLKRRPPPLSAVSEWAPIALAFIAGTAVILSAYKPGTYRRRFAALGLGCGAYAVEQFLTRNSASSPENIRWILQELKGTDFPNGVDKILPWTQTLWYAGPPYSLAYEKRRDALSKLQSHVSKQMVDTYLERESMYNNQTTLGRRMTYMWHNLWSSVETRAAIDDVAHTYLSAAGFQVGESNRMLEHDIRHFVTYTGSALEYNWIERGRFDHNRYAFYASVAAGVLCRGPWAVVFAAGVGTNAFVYHFGRVLRGAQFCEGPLKYANPEYSSVLQVFWYDWVCEKSKMLKEMESSQTKT